MRSRSVAGLVAAVCAAVTCVGFVALGTWQVERRSWKLQLIERVDRRVQAQPVAAPAADRWAAVNAADDEYRHVKLTGALLNGAETLVQASTELGAGFWVMTPLRCADGSVVLVNRGFVASERRARAAHGAAAAAEGNITITGLLRMTEPGGGFLRHNDAAADRWYSRDVAAIATARGLHRTAPYFVDADASTPLAAANDTPPIGGLTVIAFSNNHAIYALTWYVLALMAAGAAWRILRERSSGDKGDPLGARR